MPELYYIDDSAMFADKATALIPKRIGELDAIHLQIQAAQVYATLAVFSELRDLRKEIKRSQP